jgi:hypothetical protein
MALDVGLRRPDICHVCRPPGGSDTPERHVGWWPNQRLACERLDICWRGIVRGDGTKGVRVTQEQRTELGFADAHRVLQDHLKHRLQFASRRTDDAQYLRGRSLLLQRFAKLARALLFGLEQSHVLDGNRRLIGEGRQQLNLFLGEWTNARALYNDHTNREPFAQQRHTKHRMEATKLCRFKKRIFRVALNVGNMNRPAFQDGPPDDGSPAKHKWMDLHEVRDLRRLTEVRDLLVRVALLTINRSHIRVAQTNRRFAISIATISGLAYATG